MCLIVILVTFYPVFCGVEGFFLNNTASHYHNFTFHGLVCYL